MINSHRQAAYHYHDAAMEYSLLGENTDAAKYYQKSGLQYHYAALQFNILNDYTEYGKQFVESLKHKRMAKYGSDYVLPPNQQIRWLADPQEVRCNTGLELVFKSSNGEPTCFTPDSASKLVQRG